MQGLFASLALAALGAAQQLNLDEIPFCDELTSSASLGEGTIIETLTSVITVTSCSNGCTTKTSTISLLTTHCPKCTAEATATGSAPASGSAPSSAPAVVSEFVTATITEPCTVTTTGPNGEATVFTTNTVYTTYCPESELETTSPKAPGSAPGTGKGTATEWVTSTITEPCTLTSTGPNGEATVYTTNTVYTTYCPPESAGTPGSAPPKGTGSAPPKGTGSAPPKGTPSAPAEGTPSAPKAEGTPSAPKSEGTPSAPKAEGTPSAPKAEGTPSGGNEAPSEVGGASTPASGIVPSNGARTLLPGLVGVVAVAAVLL